MSGPTKGELTVVGIRAQALADDLRRAKTLGLINRLGSNPRSVFYLYAEDLEWSAARLRSSCERALGTRGRHYD